MQQQQPPPQHAWLDAAPTPILLIAMDGAAEAPTAAASTPSLLAATAAGAAVAAASSAAAIVSAAAAWRVTFINRAARRILGLMEPAESSHTAAAAAESFSARIHAADRAAAWLRDESDTASEGGGWHCSFRIAIADGSFAPVQLRANAAPVDPASAPSAESTFIASLQLMPLPATAAAANPSPALPLLHATASTDAAAPSAVPSMASAFSVSVDGQSLASTSSPPPRDVRAASDSSSVSGARSTITPLVVPFASSPKHASAMTISTSRGLPLSPLTLSSEMELSLADDMFRSLPVMLMLLHGSRIVRVSPKFTEILGWDADEVRSMHVSQLFHPEDLANISLENVRLTAGAAADEHEAAALLPSPEESVGDADAASQSTDTVVINRLRHKYTGEYVSCMFRTALSRRFFAVAAASAPGPFGGASRGSTPRSVDPPKFSDLFSSGAPAPSAAAAGAAAPAAVASSVAASESGPPRLSPPSASPSASSASPASSSPVAEPYIHALIRPMYQQERAALSNALEGIAQSKAAFISNITHELQTPMNGLVASAELLGETELSAEQTDYLNCIQISAEHMSTIIGDIVSFASIERGALQLERAPVHLNAVIEEAVTLVFRPRLHDHLEILHSLAPDLPAIVLGDSARLRQILIHLIGNALKFTRRGEIVIRVSRYDGSASPANLIRRQTEHLQALADELASGRMDPDAAQAAEAELNAPQMLVIQPPQTLPSLNSQQQQPHTTHHQLFSPSPTEPTTGLPVVAPLPAAALALVPSPSPPLDHDAENASPVSGLVSDDSSPTSPPAISPTSAAGVVGASSPPPDDDRSPFLLQFAISDSGCGIDPRHASRLFQIFSQADSSSSKEHQGTGIGLLTSLKLCRAQGGEVWCSSVTGRGSTFFFTVLCTPAAPVTQPTPLHANATLQSLTLVSSSSTPTPTPNESLPPLHASASSAPQPQSQPTMLSARTTPLARVRNLVEQENSMHRRTSTDSSIASVASSSSSTSSTAASAQPLASFDSPGSTASTNSPHRSPLVFPRFLPTFQTVCVVHTNAAVLAVLSEDLRARGAVVRTFVSPAQALVFAQTQSLAAPAIDCWIIDSLSGTALRDASGSGLESNPASTLSATSFAPGDLSGVELVARLLELREIRERARSTAALRGSDKQTIGDGEVRVVLLVQSFGLPATLPLPDSVLTSPSIRLIQVHKPVKQQVLYDAIRTLGEQISLPFSSPGQRAGSSTGRNSLDRGAAGSLSSTSSGGGGGSGSSGYAMSLTQAKSRRTLTLAMHMGSGPSAAAGAGSGDASASSSTWATRRVAINQNQRGSAASSGSRSIGHERELTSSAPASFAAAESPLHPRSVLVPHPLSLDAHEAFVPTGYAGASNSGSNNSSGASSRTSTLLSPILPPSPFVHPLGPFASSSDSSLFPTSGQTTSQSQGQMVAVAPAVALPLPRPPTSSRRSSGGKAAAGGVGAGSAASAAPRPPSYHSPHISTGKSRLRSADNNNNNSAASSAGAAAPSGSSAPVAASGADSMVLAHKYPLRILCVDDVAINLKICLKILAKLGYHADSAVDGLEAHTKVIAAAREAKRAAELGTPLPAGQGAYDLVWMDLQMPLCDGFEAGEIIMRAFGCCNLPVSGAQCVHHMPSLAQSWCAGLPSAVADHKASTGSCASPPALFGSPELAGIPRPVLLALTANTTEDDKWRCFKVGFDGFVNKPVSVNAIVTPLKKWAKEIAMQRSKQQQQTQQMEAAGAASSATEVSHDAAAAGPSVNPSSSLDESNSASRSTLSVDPSAPHQRVRNAGTGLLSPTAELGRDGEEVELPTPIASSVSTSVAADPAATTVSLPMRAPSLHALKSLDALRQMDLSSSSSSRESSPQMHPRVIQRAATHVRAASHSDGSSELDRAHSMPYAPVGPQSTAGSFSLLPPLSPRIVVRSAGSASASSSSSAASSAAPVPAPQSSSARQLTRHLPPSSRVNSSQKSPLLLHTAAPSFPSTLVESLYLAPALCVGPSHEPPTEGPLATRVRISPPVDRKKVLPNMAISLMTAADSAHVTTAGEVATDSGDSPASRAQQPQGQGRSASDAAVPLPSSASPAPSASIPSDADASSAAASSASNTTAESTSPPRHAAHKQAFLLDLAHK